MKTLNDVINAVQHETQLSRSQLSLKIGKSRNYLNTTVKNGLSYEKEQEVIALLLNLVDDEVTMLRNVLADKDDEIATKNLFIDGLDMENKGLMDNIDYLNREINLLNDEKEKLTKDSHKLKSKLQGQIDCNNAVNKANEELSSKISDLEQDLDEACGYADKTQSLLEESMRESLSQEKTIESLAKSGYSTGKQLNKEITKNRILTASIIGLVAIFSVYLWVK